jgi:hypothetical protein
MLIWSRRDLLKSIPFAAALPVAAKTEEPPKVGDAAQLFIDFDRVELSDNVVRTFHAAEKHPENPVIHKEKPWESDGGTWGSVIYDDEAQLFKSWYGGESGRQLPNGSGPRHVMLYATSRDGVHWDRPKLGLHEVMGTKENNVVVGDDHHDGMGHWESTLKDPFDPDSQRRYKAIGWSSYDWDGPLSGIYTMTSPNGLNWTHTPEPVFHFHPRPNTQDLGPIGDAQSMMIDTLNRRYIAFLRKSPDRAMSVSTDFVRWTPPAISLRPRDGEQANTIYNHVGFVYGDRFLGFLTYFDRAPRDPRLTVWLLKSPDGEHWEILNTGGPLIGSGEIGEIDRFTNMLTGAPPIRVGDRLYIYYRSMSHRHTLATESAKVREYEGKDMSLTGGGICLATLRVDGFVSLDGGYDGGQVITKSFVFTGSRLKLNAKANFGQVLVEVLDEKGKVAPKLSKDDCQPMRADSIEHEVRWKDASIGDLRGKPVKLRFYLSNARLYAYRIAG